MRLNAEAISDVQDKQSGFYEHILPLSYYPSCTIPVYCFEKKISA